MTHCEKDLTDPFQSISAGITTEQRNNRNTNKTNTGFADNSSCCLSEFVSGGEIRLVVINFQTCNLGKFILISSGPVPKTLLVLVPARSKR